MGPHAPTFPTQPPRKLPPSFSLTPPLPSNIYKQTTRYLLYAEGREDLSRLSLDQLLGRADSEAPWQAGGLDAGGGGANEAALAPDVDDYGEQDRREFDLAAVNTEVNRCALSGPVPLADT